MDQNSNVNLQVVQGYFSIKYGPKTLKTLVVSLLKKHEAISKFTFLKIQWKKKLIYVIRYTFQSHLLSELILDLWKCPNQKMHESKSVVFLLGTSQGPQSFPKADLIAKYS